MWLALTHPKTSPIVEWALLQTSTSNAIESDTYSIKNLFVCTTDVITDVYSPFILFEDLWFVLSGVAGRCTALTIAVLCYSNGRALLSLPLAGSHEKHVIYIQYMSAILLWMHRDVQSVAPADWRGAAWLATDDGRKHSICIFLIWMIYGDVYVCVCARAPCVSSQTNKIEITKSRIESSNDRRRRSGRLAACGYVHCCTSSKFFVRDRPSIIISISFFSSMCERRISSCQRLVFNETATIVQQFYLNTNRNLLSIDLHHGIFNSNILGRQKNRDELVDQAREHIYIWRSLDPPQICQRLLLGILCHRHQRSG